MKADDPLVAMELKGLMLDPTTEVPIVILREREGNHFLPIWIGIFEAKAIALRLEKVETPRPMTHDLLRNVLAALDATVLKVVISDLREATFFATVYVETPAGEREIDARPSDAIALALRTEAPLFVRRSVLESARAVELVTEAADDEKLKQWLEELDPDDLGYTM